MHKHTHSHAHTHTHTHTQLAAELNELVSSDTVIAAIIGAVSAVIDNVSNPQVI